MWSHPHRKYHELICIDDELSQSSFGGGLYAIASGLDTHTWWCCHNPLAHKLIPCLVCVKTRLKVQQCLSAREHLLSKPGSHVIAQSTVIICLIIHILSFVIWGTIMQITYGHTWFKQTANSPSMRYLIYICVDMPLAT